MKKIYVLSLMLFLSVTFTKAQTTLTTAVDFTVTDTDGNPHSLFSILASGKYVCLDFFFTTCVPCQNTVPFFKQTFTNYGCNTQDVYFMSIDNGDTDAEVDAYEAAFLGGSAGFPAVSGTEGGGDGVVAAYGIGAFPTYILIAPSHAIVEQDMWPIGSATDFDPYFSSNALVYKSCLSGVAEQELAKNISIYPNPAISNITIDIADGGKVNEIKVYDVLGKILISQSLNNVERYDLNVSGLDQGMYYIEVKTEDNIIAVKKFNKQ